MNDKELIEWIKQVKPGENMPADTGPRITRLIQILVDRTEPKKQGRPKLTLNKTA